MPWTPHATAARLPAQFRVDVPVKALFEAPTVAAMAAAVTGRQVPVGDAAEMARPVGELEGFPEAKAQRLLADATACPPRKEDQP